MALSACTRFAYGIGHVTNDLCSAVWFTYVLIFYELVLGFSSLHSGLLILVGQIADAVATPIIGYLCDRGPKCWKINLRHRKVWYLSGTIIVLLTFPFLFFDCVIAPNSTMIWKFVYYNVFVVIFQIGWAFVQIAHLAIAPDLTTEQHEYTNLMSLRTTFTVLSGLFIYLLTFLLLKWRDGDEESKRLVPNDIIKFQVVVLTSLGLGTICSLVFYFTVKESPERMEDFKKSTVRTATYRQLFQKLSLYQLIVVYMGARVFCNISQAVLTLYLNIALDMEKPTIASMPFVMFSSAFVASLLSAPMNYAIGRKFSFLIGTLIAVSASVWIWLDTSDLYKTYFIYFVTIMLGFASSVMLVTSLGAATDYIGKDTNNSAFLYGVLSFVDKLSSGVVLMVIQALAPNFGPDYYRYVFAYVCSASSVVALFCILTMKRMVEDEAPEQVIPVQTQPQPKKVSDPQPQKKRLISSL